MNKDEILAKSRKENRAGDEREIQILANSSKIGMAVGGILSAIIVVFSRVVNEPLLGLSAWAVYFQCLGADAFISLFKLRKRLGCCKQSLVSHLLLLAL